MASQAGRIRHPAGGAADHPPRHPQAAAQVLTRLEIHHRPSRLRRSLPVVGAAALAAAAGAAVLAGRQQRGG